MKTLHRAVGSWGLGLALAVAAAPPGPALAGDEMPGKHYENKLVGFRFRPLNEWAAVPPGTDPNDPKVCGFYSDKAKFENGVKPECSVYAFKVPKSEGVATPRDDGPKPPEDPLGGGDDPPANPTPEDLESALEDYRNSFRLKNTRDAVQKVLKGYKFYSDQVLSRMEEKKKKKLLAKIRTQDPVEKEIKDGDEVLTIIETSQPCALTNGEVIEVRILAGFRRNEEFEVGVVYEIPGSEWKKYGGGCMSSLRSLEFLEGAEIASARKDLEDALAGKTGDERWIEEIKRKVGPGWDYLQTKNYLVVYDKTVKPDRVRLIAVQIEAIRKDVYEVMFPPDRPITAISVVRVCKDNTQYLQYAPEAQGSAGFWNSGSQELVFYEDTSAKKDSLRVLNHEAFHQYIFYSVGSISPHDWFNEGHGDFFAGFNYDRSGRFIPAKFTWRTGEIKNAVGAKKHIELKVFMGYSHAQYYGPQIGQNYAQGWSVIWFLRTTKNPAWKGMLETYFNTLKGEVTKWVDDEIAKAKDAGTWKEGWKPSFTPDQVENAAREKALASIFGGWDDKKWERFEKEWKDGF